MESRGVERDRDRVRVGDDSGRPVRRLEQFSAERDSFRAGNFVAGLGTDHDWSQPRVAHGFGVAALALGEAVVRVLEGWAVGHIHEGDPPMATLQQFSGGVASGAVVIGADTVGVTGAVDPDCRDLVPLDEFAETRGDIVGVVDQQPVAGRLAEQPGNGLFRRKHVIRELEEAEVDVVPGQGFGDAKEHLGRDIAAVPVNSEQQRDGVESALSHDPGRRIRPITKTFGGLKDFFAGLAAVTCGGRALGEDPADGRLRHAASFCYFVGCGHDEARLAGIDFMLMRRSGKP